MATQNKKQKKERPENYEKKVSINGTFEQAIKHLAKAANKKSAAPPTQNNTKSL